MQSIVVVDISVMAHGQIPMVVEFLQLQYIDKVIDVCCAAPAVRVQTWRSRSSSHSCNVDAGHVALLPVVASTGQCSTLWRLRSWHSLTGLFCRARQNSVERAAGNCRQDIVQTRVQKPETYSQVWKGDNQSQRSCGKLQHCAHDHVMHQRSCGKLQHCAHDHVMHQRSCGKLLQDNAQGAVLDSSKGTAGNCRQGTVQGNMPKS